MGPRTVKAQQLCDIDCEKSKKNDGSAINEHYKFIPIVNGNLTSTSDATYDGKNFHIYSLTTKETTNAGLFGTVSNNLAVTDCRVCWKDSEKQVKDTDGDSNADSYVYAVSGTNAGGLVGSVASGGNVTIKNSFAAPTVMGTTNAVGLVGSASGTVTIQNSYADCYLNTGTGTDAKAAGGVEMK